VADWRSRQWSFQFHKRRGISYVSKRLSYFLKNDLLNGANSLHGSFWLPGTDCSLLIPPRVPLQSNNPLGCLPYQTSRFVVPSELARCMRAGFCPYGDLGKSLPNKGNPRYSLLLLPWIRKSVPWADWSCKSTFAQGFPRYLKYVSEVAQMSCAFTVSLKCVEVIGRFDGRRFLPSCAREHPTSIGVCVCVCVCDIEEEAAPTVATSIRSVVELLEQSARLSRKMALVAKNIARTEESGCSCVFCFRA
jgi:hypothetical protein